MYKLFTHTDLDGVGCYLVAKNLLDEKIDVEYCDYNNINERVECFINGDYGDYKGVFITDISVNETVAELLDSISKDIEIKLLDHHATALWLNKYLWADVRELNNFNQKTSGTEMLYEHLYKGYAYNCHLTAIVADITLYDSWRWINDYKTPYKPSKRLNDLFYLIDRELFVQNMLYDYDMDKFSMLLDIEESSINKKIETKKKEFVKTLLIKDINGIDRSFGFCFSDKHNSELGNELAKCNDDLDFVAIIDIAKKSVSLRGIKPESHIHIGKDIASMFDGGGHAQSAGCKLQGYLLEVVKEWLTD